MASNTSMSAVLIASANCRILTRRASSSMSFLLLWFSHAEGACNDPGARHIGVITQEGTQFSAEDRPSETAQAAIWAREPNPSLARMCWTWFSAVRSASNRNRAISRLVRPRATSTATSRSRLDSRTDPVAGPECPHPEGRCGAGGPLSQVAGLAASTSLAAEQLCQHEFGSGRPGPRPGRGVPLDSQVEMALAVIQTPEG